MIERYTGEVALLLEIVLLSEMHRLYIVSAAMEINVSGTKRSCWTLMLWECSCWTVTLWKSS